jgi:hypothetical protein
MDFKKLIYGAYLEVDLRFRVRIVIYKGLVQRHASHAMDPSRSLTSKVIFFSLAFEMVRACS